MKSVARGDAKRKGRGRRAGNRGVRSPRKSPRCHASTLAIMSTIIRKREQVSSLVPVKEEAADTSSAASEPPSKQELHQLKETAKNIDDFLLNVDLKDIDDVLDLDSCDVVDFDSTTAKGPPTNLVDLLENCHAMVPIIEYSSCNSSDYGEMVELPQKKRKKRKNKTGWPGIRMRRKLGARQVDESGQDDGEQQKVDEQEVTVPSVKRGGPGRRRGIGKRRNGGTNLWGLKKRSFCQGGTYGLEVFSFENDHFECVQIVLGKFSWENSANKISRFIIEGFFDGVTNCLI